MAKNLALVVLLFNSAVLGQNVAFEGSDFPETYGWTHVEHPFPAERWIENGWLVQETESASGGQEGDHYRRSISEFAGASSFFVDWRMITDGPRTGIPSGSPALLSVTGSMGVLFHFTIAKDQARLIDSYLNVYWFEFSAETSHVFRLEVRGQDSLVMIDGTVVYTDAAPLPYPSSDSFIVFSARHPGVVATTRWDYIRYGVIPDDAGPGDLNCDGTINPFDIVPFVDALASPDEYGQKHPACQRRLADANGDGSINQFDILPFIDLLIR